MRISDAELEAILQEDIGYGDLTSVALGLQSHEGVMRFVSRSEFMVASMVEEAARMCRLLDLDAKVLKNTKDLVQKGEILLEVRGCASSLHEAWKSVQNLLDYACGIATYSYELVQKAKEINPEIVIATTRKNPPYLKKIALASVKAGGAIAHRTSLSETLLVFGHHRTFFEDENSLAQALKKVKSENPERMLVVEVKNSLDALKFAQMGVDALQLDKLPLEELEKTAKDIRAFNKQIKIIATGGITKENVAGYASLDVDMLVSSSPYFAKPADIKVEMEALRQ